MTEKIGQPDEPDHSQGGIPVVSDEIIQAHRAEPKDFEKLFALIGTADPTLMRFIMGRAEQLASGKPGTKLVAAQVAMEALAVLRSQAEADALNNEYREPPTPEIPPTAA